MMKVTFPANCESVQNQNSYSVSQGDRLIGSASLLNQMIWSKKP